MKPDKTKKDIIIKKQSKKDLKDIIKSLNTDFKIFKENGNVKGTENGKYKQMKIFYKYLRDKYKENKENKKTKMTKEDYIKIIKKQYPYYVYLNKYKIDELKEISERVCNNIYINYDGYNSCYIDSLMVALFNTKNAPIPLGAIRFFKDTLLQWKRAEQQYKPEPPALLRFYLKKQIRLKFVKWLIFLGSMQFSNP